MDAGWICVAVAVVQPWTCAVDVDVVGFGTMQLIWQKGNAAESLF